MAAVQEDQAVVIGDPEVLEVGGSPEALFKLFDELGWGDGLPIVAPTPERVDWMLRGTSLPPDELVAKIPPRYGMATVKKIAINAVIAGCRPDYMPVLIAAVRAMAQPQFNLAAVQTTTHPAAPLLIVNGPMRQRLRLNSGAGLFGPGWRANATIGRAIRLILLNVGGAAPGAVDRATLGSPAKYSYCIAENEEANPWAPYHVDRGFAREDSTVTLYGAEAPHNINDHVSGEPKALLTVFADGMAKLGTNNTYATRITEMLVGICPEHTATIAQAGWTKGDVQEFLYQEARQTMRRVKIGGMYGMHQWPKWFEALDDDAMVPIAESPDRIHIMVIGGSGKHSCVIPTAGTTQSAIERIER